MTVKSTISIPKRQSAQNRMRLQPRFRAGGGTAIPLDGLVSPLSLTPPTSATKSPQPNHAAARPSHAKSLSAVTSVGRENTPPRHSFVPYEAEQPRRLLPPRPAEQEGNRLGKGT